MASIAIGLDEVYLGRGKAQLRPTCSARFVPAGQSPFGRCAKLRALYINQSLSTSAQPLRGDGAHSKVVEVLMPSYGADEAPEHPLVNPPALLELSVTDRTLVQRLIGHTLACIEREFILQTLRWCQGNRTRT
jgi:hypothetical protein